MPQARQRSQRVSCLLSTCAIALVVQAASGCAAQRVAEIPASRDLSVLHVGASRTEVLAEFGAPIWTEEHDHGAVDVFEFKQGYRKGVQTLRAIGLGTANLLSLGSKRDETDAALAAGTEMKVHVCYDETHHIDSVRVLEGPNLLPQGTARWFRTPSATTATASRDNAARDKSSHDSSLR